MIFFKALPLCILLLILDQFPAVAAGFVPRALERARQTAARHTRRFARDLRITFGTVLVTQDSGQQAPKRVVYCKSAPNSLTGSSGNGGNSTGGSGSKTTASGTSTRVATPSGTPVSTPWHLVESYEGQDFFNGWDFWTTADPTHGTVDYVDESTARSNGLLEVNDAGNAIMRVETTDTVASNRQSIRITTQRSFDGALILMDSVHMPHGCGTWPAFWTNGPNWPAGGEIDIIEGVGDYTNNQATIHTDPGCKISSDSSSTLGITGNVIGGTNCAAAETSNQGCGIRSDSSASYGAPFNANGGGVYAMQWDADGIAIYFFPRGDIPSDIDAGTPLPSKWGKPMAFWPSAGCDPFKFFYTNVAIFDTTLCGDWAGGVWDSSGIPGQEESCASRTGVSTCEAFVRGNGASFKDAYWEVKYVKIYQTS